MIFKCFVSIVSASFPPSGYCGDFYFSSRLSLNLFTYSLPSHTSLAFWLDGVEASSHWLVAVNIKHIQLSL